MTDSKQGRGRKASEPTVRVPIGVVGLFIVVLIGLMVWLTDRFVEYDKLQRCVTAGHRDCGPPISAPQ